MSFPHKSPSTELPANLKFENTSFAAQAKMNTYNKPAIFVQNNNNPTVQKSRPRGGWDDGEDEPTLNINTNKQNSLNQMKSSPVSTGTNSTAANDSTPTIDEFVATKKSEIKECDEAFFNKNEYEAKIVMELIQPGGARIKPSDAVLNEFCRACESLQTQVIGSLLFYNLEASIAWQSKAKNLYAIEALVKKVKKYNEYFKANVIVLKAKQFPNDGPNSVQLKKILTDVTNVIDGVSTLPQQPKTPQNNGIATTQPKFIQEIDPLDETQGWQNPIKEDKQEASPAKTQLKVTTTPIWGNPTNPPVVQNTKPEVKSANQPQVKLNPFGIAPSTNPVQSQSATNKPSSGGLPGAFKNKTLNANTSPSIAKSTSSVSSQDEYKNKQPSLTSSTLPQPSSITDQGTNSLITSLSGLDFGNNNDQNSTTTPTNKLNDLYSLYPQQQPVYNMPMPYPQQFPDPHMMGPGPYPQPFYPPPQQFNGSPYGVPQYQGQFPPPQQFNHGGYPPNYPMQGFPGYPGPGPMMYNAPEGFSPQNQFQNQNHGQQQNGQNGEEEEELSQPTQAEIQSREEQERKRQEEMQKMKKQQEIENKFDSLKFNFM